MSRQDKLEIPEIENGRPDTPVDDGQLQIDHRLGLDKVAAAEEEKLRNSPRRRPTKRELTRLASRLYDARRGRDRMFTDKLFGEPAWDMLLALYCLPARGEILTVTSLGYAAGVPPSSANRWQKLLHGRGLIKAGPDLSDGRQRLVGLSDKGRMLMEKYLIRLFYCQSGDISEVDGLANNLSCNLTREAQGWHDGMPEACMAGERDGQKAVLNRALALITEAMDLLDAHGSDPKAASYAALAQQQLRTTLVQSEQSKGSETRAILIAQDEVIEKRTFQGIADHDEAARGGEVGLARLDISTWMIVSKQDAGAIEFECVANNGFQWDWDIGFRPAMRREMDAFERRIEMRDPKRLGAGIGICIASGEEIPGSAQGT